MAWTWTKQKEEAAAFVAEDLLTNDEIAAKVGVARRSLIRWKSEPTFAARVDALIADFRVAVRSRGVAILERRVDRLNNAHRDLQQIIRERQAAAFAQHAAHEACDEERRKLQAELLLIQKRAGERRKPLRIPNEVDEANAAVDADRAKEIKARLAAIDELDPGPIRPGEDTGHVIREVTYTKGGPQVKYIADISILAELRAIEMQAAKELGQWTDNLKHSGAIGSNRLDLSRLKPADLEELERIVESATVTNGDPG